jgi:hypothetical protein
VVVAGLREHPAQLAGAVQGGIGDLHALLHPDRGDPRSGLHDLGQGSVCIPFPGPRTARQILLARSDQAVDRDRLGAARQRQRQAHGQRGRQQQLQRGGGGGGVASAHAQTLPAARGEGHRDEASEHPQGGPLARDHPAMGRRGQLDLHRGDARSHCQGEQLDVAGGAVLTQIAAQHGLQGEDPGPPPGVAVPGLHQLLEPTLHRSGEAVGLGRPPVGVGLGLQALRDRRDLVPLLARQGLAGTDAQDQRLGSPEVAEGEPLDGVRIEHLRPRHHDPDVSEFSDQLQPRPKRRSLAAGGGDGEHPGAGGPGQLARGIPAAVIDDDDRVAAPGEHLDVGRHRVLRVAQHEEPRQLPQGPGLQLGGRRWCRNRGAREPDSGTHVTMPSPGG